MSATAHAVLSASGAHRWLACPPSARLEQEFPEQTSAYAEEGTLAHALAELHLKHFLGEVAPEEFSAQMKTLTENPMYTPEMSDHVLNYVDLAVERVNEARAKARDAVVMVEHRLDFSPWVPGGFGTGDLVLLAGGTVEVVDLKFGKGVAVSAENNPQIRLYALGALHEFGMLYDIETVRMTIVQPRLDSVSTDEMSAVELLAWAETEVKPKAELAARGEGEFAPGDHCRFCRARHACRARAAANLEIAKHEFRNPDLLTDEEIAEVLTRAEALQQWVSDLREYALREALNGRRWPGWKVVEGRSQRKIVDEFEAARRLLDAGYDPDAIAPRTLLGIAKLEKLLGPKRFSEMMDGIIEKPPGKPTLVPESDPRPEMVSSAVEDFADDYQEIS